MSGYAPGAVAMVQLRDGHWDYADLPNPMRAFKLDGLIWRVYTPDGPSAYGEGAFAWVRPLVALDLTREDADLINSLIQGTENYVSTNGGMSPGEVRQRLVGIRDAIREQTPAPLEIPERIGAVVETDDGETHRWVFDGNEWCRGSGCGRVGAVTTWVRKHAVRVLSEGVPDA